MGKGTASSVEDIKELSAAIKVRASGKQGRVSHREDRGANDLIKTLDSASFQEQVGRCIPSGINFQVDKLIRAVKTQLRTDMKLVSCDPVSVLAAVMECAQIGLIPGFQKHVFISARERKDTTGGFGFEAQVIPGYKGLIALAMRSGEIKSITSRTVTDKEIASGLFTLSYEGERDYLRHEPILLNDRGKDVLAYCIVRFNDGQFIVEYMNEQQLTEIKDNALMRLGVNAKDSAWLTHEIEMWRKTVIRRALKHMDLSVDGMDAALRMDETASSESGQNLSESYKAEFPEFANAAAAAAVAAVTGEAANSGSKDTGNVVASAVVTPIGKKANPEKPESNEQKQEKNPDDPSAGA